MADRHRRKHRANEFDDEDERTDYSNAPTQSVDDVESPFRDPSAVDSEAVQTENVDVEASVEEPPRTIQAEVPIEDLLAPPKRRGENISAGYEILSSPRARVYTIESSDPSMSIISSGDESWEHVSHDEDDTVSVGSNVDRKPYAQVVKEPFSPPTRAKSPSELEDAPVS